MAKFAAGKTANPHTACANEPKKHVKGMKGTPYSTCVRGAERLLKYEATSKAAVTSATSTSLRSARRARQV
jgi:hypothetical protein